MDRSIVYPGAAAQDVDLLFPQRAAMQALGTLAKMVLGDTTASGPLINGFGVAPTAPASMQVVVGAGALFGMDAVDATAYGSLAADTTHQIMQIAINPDPMTLPALTAPSGAGQTQIYLIELQAVTSDAGEIVLPFWNAAAPSQPFLGLANSGGALPTQRLRRVSVQAIAGAVAASGSAAVAPSPTVGWTPLATVQLSGGQTTIVSSNLAAYQPSSFLPFTMPQLTPGFSRRIVLSSASGSAGGNQGVFTVPAGVRTMKVTSTGGGGGGSGCQASGNGSAICGGCGGAGATEVAIMSVTPGQAISWIVGLGGGSQANGGATSFGNLPAANGGFGSPGFSGTAGNMYSPGGLGGAASATGYCGGDGSDGQNATATTIGGLGGASFWGGGGRSASGQVSGGAVTQHGANGRAWGAGGGGTNDLTSSTVAFPGGAGAPGVIIVEY